MLKLSDGVKDALKLHNLELTPLELDALSEAVDELADVTGSVDYYSERGAFVVDVRNRQVEQAFLKNNLGVS